VVVLISRRKPCSLFWRGIYPRVMELPPPGGASTRELGLSVMNCSRKERKCLILKLDDDTIDIEIDVLNLKITK
jgi:hypothetical protein